MTTKLSRIPSWVVAVAGGAVVVVATAIFGLGYQQVHSEKVRLAQEAVSARDLADRLWASHLNGDRRANEGDVFRALAIGARFSGNERLAEYAFDRAAVRLRAAVQSTVAAANLDAAPLDVRAVEERVRRGDASAYVEISDVIDDLRNQSIKEIKDLDARAAELGARTRTMDGELALIYAAHVFFNILGLCIVMCKDLPVWRQ